MSFGAIAITGMAIGTGVSAYGQYKAGKEAKKLSKQEARYQREIAEMQAQRIEWEAPRKLGTIAAVLSTSGRSFTEGTGLELLAEAAGELAIDAYITRRGGDIRADSALSEGKLLETRGKFGAAGTLISGVTNIAAFKMG